MDEVRYLESSGLPFITDPTSGVDRVLGVLPDDHGLCGFKSYGEAPGQGIIPRSEWKEVDYSHFEVPVLDQGNQGSCGGHAVCTSFSRNWVADGKPGFRFSPCFVYGLVNGGRDQGSLISDLLAVMRSTGICFESEVGPGQIYKSNYPKTAYDTAKRFRIKDAYFLEGFDALASAIQHNRSVVFGIPVGSRFNSVDSAGVAGLPSYGERTGGHALSGHGLVKIKSGKFAGRWGIGTQNSWGNGYGIKGKCVLIEEHFQTDYGMFAIELSVDDAASDPGIIAI